MAADKPLQETLSQLLERMETLHAEKNNQMEDAGKVSASLDRLAELIADLELQRSRENKLAQKLEILANQMDRLVKEPPVRTDTDKRSLEHTLRSIIAGTRTVGQVIEIIANSAQVMFDSIIKTFNEYKVSTAQGTRNAKTSLDLARVLDPINALLRNLASQENKENTPVASDPADGKER
ncbi:MAG: hypothetical protein IMW93_11005 [Thermoanaerobacteraceae bacterium]|nr:hypothetical protein [Thermoanaerobacteraceae bacterium]